jgi:hypothetical protein
LEFLADAVELLISQGHSNPFSYTPKQVFSFYEICMRRKKRDLARSMDSMRVAMHGDDKVFRAMMEELLG